MEKCTPENGALSFLPGSHITAPIAKRFVRLPDGGTGFERLLSPEEEARAMENSQGKYVIEECAPGMSIGCTVQNMACLNVYLGDLVLIHGSILHKSGRNTSPNTRFAYTFHMIESSPLAEYDEKNWLQPTSTMPFSRVLGGSNSTTITA